MDVDDDWELLSDDDQIYSGNPVFQMNYFTPKFVPDPAPAPAPVDLPSPAMEEEDRISQAEFVDMKKVESPKSRAIEEKFDAEMNEKEGGEGEGEGEGLGVWKRGIGAICSFGVAVCIIVFTNKNNHNLHFRIYTDDKRMKTISGAPIARARITVGGYYDASSPSPTKSM